jgi:hypothetical protein
VGIADGRRTILRSFMRLAGRQQGVADMQKPIFETLLATGPPCPLGNKPERPASVRIANASQVPVGTRRDSQLVG